MNLLNKGVVNLSRFGVDVLEQPYSVTITFSSMSRLCALFNKFEDCQGFTNKLGVGKGEVKLIVDDRKYKYKEEMLELKFHYGHWNAFGILHH